MRYRSPALQTALLLAFALSGASACAQQEPANAASTEWKESPVQFPAAPQKDNLLPFYGSNANTMRFTIDAKSVSVENDGVIRYTLVITSKSGANNISYEGIRCSTYELKLYAFGQADGSWSPARRDSWDPIRDTGVNQQHISLVKDYFCDGSRPAGNAAAIVDRIRYKRPLK